MYGLENLLSQLLYYFSSVFSMLILMRYPIYVIRNANTSHIFNIVAVELKHVRILIWAAFREVHSLFNRHYYNHLRQ